MVNILPLKSLREILRKLVLTPTWENEEGNFINFLQETFSNVKILKKQKVEGRRYNLILGTHNTKLKKCVFGLFGHIDTVMPMQNLYFKEDEKFFYGLGTSDMKASLAVYLYLAENFPELFEKVCIILTVDEEYHMKGAKKIIEKLKDYLPNLRYGILGEPTNLLIGIKQKGLFSVLIKVIGKESHAALPEKGKNAIHSCANLINYLLIYKPKDFGTFQITKIEGGIQLNRVPYECKFHIDSRIDKEVKKSQIKKFILLSAKKIGVKIKIEKLSYYAPYTIQFPKILLPKNFKKTLLPYFTESYFYKKIGINTLVFGPGSWDVAHTAKERVKKSNVIKYVYIIKEILEKVNHIFPDI